MATEFNFNGRLIKLPGVYTQVKSGISNIPFELSYGNVLIIDSDVSSEFGGGSGVSGENAVDKDSIYSFDNIRALRSFVRGGEIWDLAAPLFKPFGAGITGASRVYYTRPFITTSAESVNTITDSGNGFQLDLKVRHEGLCGNGSMSDEALATGSIEITTAGVTGEIINVLVDGVTIGSYTQAISDTQADIADGLVAAINVLTPTTGYSADNTTTPNIVDIISVPGYGDTRNGDLVTNTGTFSGTVALVNIAGGITGNNLIKGFGFKIVESPSDPTKFVVKFYRGSFTGLAEDNLPYDGIGEAGTSPELIATSTSFNTWEELNTWMQNDFDFNNSFVLQNTSAAIGTGIVNTAAVAPFEDMQVFRNGTQSYSGIELNKLLDSVADLDYTFVLAPDAQANATSAINNAILDHLVSDAKFEKFLVVGGGNDKATFQSQTITAAESFNSDRVTLVHGGIKVSSNISGTGLRTKSSKYKAAMVLGRTCGLEPQTPITFKGLSYAAEVHPLLKNEKELALDKGVLVTAYDDDLNTFAIVQGVNTLQNNRNVVNEDGTSHSISLKRIMAQLNKEIQINAKISLLGNQNAGPNRNTLEPAVVTEWVRVFLQRKTATTTQDNLILSSQDITLEIIQDAYSITYSVVPNFEINKLFITSVIIDPNLN